MNCCHGSYWLRRSHHGSNDSKLWYALHSNDMVKGCSAGYAHCLLPCGSPSPVFRPRQHPINNTRKRSASRLLHHLEALSATATRSIVSIYTSGRPSPLVVCPLVESLAFDSIFHPRQHPILTIQGDIRFRSGRALVWLVDPLSGTTNHSIRPNYPIGRVY